VPAALGHSHCEGRCVGCDATELLNQLRHLWFIWSRCGHKQKLHPRRLPFRCAMWDLCKRLWNAIWPILTLACALGMFAASVCSEYIAVLFPAIAVADLGHWDGKDCRFISMKIQSCEVVGVESNTNDCADFCLFLNVTYEGLGPGKTVGLNVTDPCGFEKRCATKS
jgi:hypothetical protein